MDSNINKSDILNDLLENSTITPDETSDQELSTEEINTIKNNTLELRGNVLNQLKLLATSTFEDIYCFLDEDLQNAQRAGATEFSVTTDYDSRYIEIYNNGSILEDMQKLFSMNETGWSADVVAEEEPFGLGFFSNTVASKKIKVYSGNKMVEFNVIDMINTGNVSLEEVILDEDEYVDGFRIELSEIDNENIVFYEIRERLELLAKYSKLDIYYNHTKLDRKESIYYNGNDVHINIDNDEIKGFIVPSTYYLKGINIFHKQRLVTTLEHFPYCEGDLHISKDIVTLKSPDRKGIVNDSKYREFKQKIKAYLDELRLRIVKDCDEETITAYSNFLSGTDNKELFKTKTKFLTINTSDKEQRNHLRNICLTSNKFNNIAEYEASLEEQEEEEKPSLDKALDVKNPSQEVEEDISEHLNDEISDTEIDIEHEIEKNSSSVVVSHTTTTTAVEQPKKETKKHIGAVETVKGTEPVFWVRYDEIIDYTSKIALAEVYSVKVIIPRNSFESSILETMQESHNVFHISKLKEEVSLLGNLSSVELSSSEKRALALLSFSAKLAGFDYDVFKLGNLMVTKKVKVESLNKEFESVEETVVACLSKDLKHINVDRSIVNKVGLLELNGSILTNSDIAFILTNIEMIATNLELLSGEQINPKTKEQYISLICTNLGKSLM